MTDDIGNRDFDSPALRRVLDAIDVDAIAYRLGPPHIVTRYAPTRGHWSQGQPLPAIHDEDPAVQQAIGRCATARLQSKAGFTVGAAIHDRARCAWCDHPVDELLRTCDWAVFRSRYVETELLVWYADHERRRGARYMRPNRSDTYENPTHAAFWSLPSEDRQQRIRAAQYPEETA